ncbi:MULTISPECIES: CHAT domain-containing tetratricopeptide repeat protein [Nostocales]|uniref:CHAT domain-containing protein n=3 Tax=Nostocales TaxID=1161 RepID=A0A0C1NKX9_9CYAN
MLNQYRRYIQRRSLGFLFLCSLTFCLWLNHAVLIGEVVRAQTPDAGQLLVQQGVENYQVGRLQSAIKDWEQALTIYKDTHDRASEAVVLENLARAYQQVGQMDKSIAYWDKAIAHYRQVGDVQQVGRMLIEQSQVYNSLGQPRKAIALLCGVLQGEPQEEPSKEVEKNSDCRQESALLLTRFSKDRTGEAGALGSLGEAYRLVGYYDRSIQYLESAEKIAPKGFDFLVLNSLGNAYVSRAELWNLRAESAKQSSVQKVDEFQQKSKSDYQKALNKFQSSFEKAGSQDNQVAQIRVLMNLIQFYYRTQAEPTQFNKAVEKALALREKLPDSTSKVYITVDLANLPVVTKPVSSPLTQCPLQRQLSDEQASALLQDAVKVADNIQDSRSLSFANGARGHFYECRQQYEPALELTRKALWQADQKLKAKDSLYLWQWQVGRIFNKQNKKSEAVTAYQEAYSTLEEIRSDLLEADRDLQFDFRDVVEPLYRELAQLRLEIAEISSIEPENRNEQLKTALETIDSLKLAELQNYFGNDCVISAINNSKNPKELLQKNTAVLSSIIFDNRTAIVLNLPNGTQQVEWINEKREDLEKEIQNFSQFLRDGDKTISDDNIKQASQKLYSKIFQKIENKANLAAENIKTLVFIQDGFFRSIPMAALYDGKQYLIEKYAIATTPSLRLTASQQLNRQHSRALILGVTTKVKVDEIDYPILPKVSSEIKNVQQLFPNSKVLVNSSFNRNNLGKELKKTAYPIIHIATHAQFGIIAEDTFLVAGDNDKLTIKELENTLRQVNGGLNSVELLTLTACQTAVGDDRATLGLAGVALQVGVKSALATLWSVNDDSTFHLISAFYDNFRKSGVSKAEALRQAQLKLINAKKIDSLNDQYDNPAYWAPFILSGNWL